MIEQFRVDARHFLALDRRNRLAARRHRRRRLEPVIVASRLGTTLEADGNAPGHRGGGSLRWRCYRGGLERVDWRGVNAGRGQAFNFRRGSVDGGSGGVMRQGRD